MNDIDIKGLEKPDYIKKYRYSKTMSLRPGSSTGFLKKADGR